MPVEQVYLRGSQIRFVIVPSMFKNAPMFKRVRAQAKQRITQQMRDKYKKARDAIINAKQDKKQSLGSVEQRNIWFLYHQSISTSSLWTKQNAEYKHNEIIKILV